MRRFVITGAPGAGKTAVLRLLENRGYPVVEEAATDVIALDQALGDDEPWTDPAFVDRILALQQRRLAGSAHGDADVVFFDRSPVCTLALSRHLGRPTSRTLAAATGQLVQDCVFERWVFFVGNLGHVRPTAARRISFEESLVSSAATETCTPSSGTSSSTSRLLPSRTVSPRSWRRSLGCAPQPDPRRRG